MTQSVNQTTRVALKNIATETFGSLAEIARAADLAPLVVSRDVTGHTKGEIPDHRFMTYVSACTGNSLDQMALIEARLRDLLPDLPLANYPAAAEALVDGIDTRPARVAEDEVPYGARKDARLLKKQTRSNMDGMMEAMRGNPEMEEAFNSWAKFMNPAAEAQA